MWQFIDKCDSQDNYGWHVFHLPTGAPVLYFHSCKSDAYTVRAPHVVYHTLLQALKLLVFLSCSPKPKQKDSTQASNGQRNSSSENLIQLYKRLVALKDSNLLQRIADILEATGRFELTETTMDFDLCSLDKTTIKKIESSISR